MKVTFRPQRYRVKPYAGNISVKGAFRGLGIDFLAVMARLYQMPFLWFSEGLTIEVDFDSKKLILTAPEDDLGNFRAQEVVQEIPLKELVCLPVSELRDKYLRNFAANLAEDNFNMPETAKAIREERQRSLILELAADEGHPVLDTEINNLLFRDEWGIKTSFEECS